ncbi:hypothetical protein LX36DRAFT_382651 [Colletotrichum falcatum]|nr:hypothetical protein LX36DRAFT_382651 [Colletotrichum falcatum]
MRETPLPSSKPLGSLAAPHQVKVYYGPIRDVFLESRWIGPGLGPLLTRAIPITRGQAKASIAIVYRHSPARPNTTPARGHNLSMSSTSSAYRGDSSSGLELNGLGFGVSFYHCLVNMSLFLPSRRGISEGKPQYVPPPLPTQQAGTPLASAIVTSTTCAASSSSAVASTARTCPCR